MHESLIRKENAVARYLANRFPVLVLLVGAVNLFGLVMLGLVVLSPSPAGVHVWPLAIGAISSASAVALAVEIFWLLRHHSSTYRTPEDYLPPSGSPMPRALRNPPPEELVEEPQLLEVTALAVVSRAMQKSCGIHLEERAMPYSAMTPKEREAYAARVALVTALRNVCGEAAAALDRWQEMGSSAEGSGRRQMENCERSLERMMIGIKDCFKISKPRRIKACKSRTASDNRHR